jgi:hypothetical protein
LANPSSGNYTIDFGFRVSDRFFIATPHLDRVCTLSCNNYYNVIAEGDVSGQPTQKIFQIPGASGSVYGSLTKTIFEIEKEKRRGLFCRICNA